MKVNREKVIHAALELLDDVGLEQLTLRLIGSRLKVQPATIYWHFKDKQALIDEMATFVLGEGAPHLLPAKNLADPLAWASSYGHGMRRTLLARRDSARMVSGTRLTDTIYMQAVEQIAAHLVASGYTVRQTIVLLSTIYNYTLSFVAEEQAVFPVLGERSPQYDIAERNAHLDPRQFSVMRQAGAILFDRFDRRYKEGLDLILRGAH